MQQWLNLGDIFSCQFLQIMLKPLHLKPQTNDEAEVSQQAVHSNLASGISTTIIADKSRSGMAEVKSRRQGRNAKILYKCSVAVVC